jgi:uncharacterized protein (TIGR02265 family)
MNPQERVVFATSVEGLLRTVPERSASLRAGMQALGIDPSHLQAAYPYEAFIGLMQLIARDRWPGLDDGPAMFEVGRALMKGYRETLVGRAVSTTARLIGPGRTLERFARSLKTANNYTESASQKLGPQHYRLELKPVRFPTYYQGVVTEVLSFLGYPEARIEIASIVGEEIALEVRW